MELVVIAEVVADLVKQARTKTESPPFQRLSEFGEDPEKTVHKVIGEIPIAARWLFNLAAEVAEDLQKVSDDDRPGLLSFQHGVLMAMWDIVGEHYPGLKMEGGIILKKWTFAVRKDWESLSTSLEGMLAQMNAPAKKH